MNPRTMVPQNGFVNRQDPGSVVRPGEFGMSDPNSVVRPGEMMGDSDAMGYSNAMDPNSVVRPGEFGMSDPSSVVRPGEFGPDRQMLMREMALAMQGGQQMPQKMPY